MAHKSRLGRFVNDSKYPNAYVKPIYVDEKLHLCIFASVDIEEGMELRYSYGVGNLDWRKVLLCLFDMFI